MFIRKNQYDLLVNMLAELTMQRLMWAELYFGTSEGQTAQQELLQPCAVCRQQAMVEPYRDASGKLCLTANLLCPSCAAIDQGVTQ